MELFSLELLGLNYFCGKQTSTAMDRAMDADRQFDRRVGGQTDVDIRNRHGQPGDKYRMIQVIRIHQNTIWKR